MLRIETWLNADRTESEWCHFISTLVFDCLVGGHTADASCLRRWNSANTRAWAEAKSGAALYDVGRASRKQSYGVEQQTSKKRQRKRK